MKRVREDNLPKPRALKPSVKQLIVNRAITDRNTPREFLATELIKEIKEAGEVAPTLETAKRYISKARNSEDPLSEPWSIAACSKYNQFFYPDSISVLIDYKRWFKNLMKGSDSEVEFRNLFGRSISDFSIRHAIWVVRLKPVVEKVFADEIPKRDNVLFGNTASIALIYETAEHTCEILNEKFTSLGLDNALVNGDLDTLSEIGGLAFQAGTKPANCDHDCDNCKNMPIPGSKIYCMPRPKKESEK